MVEASKDEALNAVEFYNKPASRRPLETFLVHMHIAWLYLLQAQFDRAGISYHYRDPKHPTRYLKVDGERKTWTLERCLSQRWPDTLDPVRENLTLTIKLRNKIEHRYESGLMVSAAGFTQALMLNYEEELVGQFGSDYSIADRVHFPVALSTFSREGVARLVAVQESLPQRLRDFFVQYRSGLDEAVRDDRRFEFRIEILQKRSAQSEADLAVSFVREEDLTDKERQAYAALERTGRVIIREKERPVVHLGRLKPSAVCARVEAAIPFRFRPSAEFPQAWKRLTVRPPSTATGAAKARTDERYCIYDEPHNDYVYTEAFVALLIEKCATAEGFLEVVGRESRPKTGVAGP